MKRLFVIATLLGLLVGGSVWAVSDAGDTTDAPRADCPGKITCPLTGEEVCKDQCPLRDTAREDCPGKIECPLTGELVCRDRCPLNEAKATEKTVDAELPPCCRNNQ